MGIRLYAGLASFRQISAYYHYICLPGIPSKMYALGDLPFECPPIEYIIDSGAFQDVSKAKRLSFSEALERQLYIAELAQYPPDYLVTYDFLVDEKYVEGRGKLKIRAGKEHAEHCVAETIAAAKYYDQQRHNIKGAGLIVSGQGVNVEQYTRCVASCLEYTQPGDIFGLGGFCIIGRKKSLVPEALMIFQSVLPLIKSAGLKRVHIFGVGMLDVLSILDQMCLNLDLELSTDTTGMSWMARLGNFLDPADGREKYLGKTVRNSPALAVINVENLANILASIQTRYQYKGKSGWLAACDFDYYPAQHEEMDLW